MKKAHLVAALLALFGASFASETSEGTQPFVEIRPGMSVHAFANAWCTGNFLFYNETAAGEKEWFLGMAAHCTRRVGDPVRNVALGVFGALAYRYGHLGDEGFPEGDFALVRIDPAFRDLVNPAVCHWGGPTALFDDIPPASSLWNRFPEDESGLWPKVQVYGWGTVDWEESRAREGRLVGVSPLQFDYMAHTYAGDSGMPVLSRTGAAIGVATGGFSVSPIVPAPTYSGGFLLKPLLERAEAELGLGLELATAPLKDPPAPDASCSEGEASMIAPEELVCPSIPDEEPFARPDWCDDPGSPIGP